MLRRKSARIELIHDEIEALYSGISVSNKSRILHTLASCRATQSLKHMKLWLLVLYGYGTSSFTLRNEQRLRVFEGENLRTVSKSNEE
jgi:hypothetical protein